tara:strand:- start:309 stop:452 length:144 start_codon:yes stop_codon:yes gene_type:complete
LDRSDPSVGDQKWVLKESFCGFKTQRGVTYEYLVAMYPYEWQKIAIL